MWSVSNVRGAQSPNNPRGMVIDEVHITARLLTRGLKCFSVYSIDQSDFKDEKEILELFSGVFTVADTRAFQVDYLISKAFIIGASPSPNQMISSFHTHTRTGYILYAHADPVRKYS